MKIVHLIKRFLMRCGSEYMNLGRITKRVSRLSYQSVCANELAGSSSGGAFSFLAKKIISEGGVVFGVVFKDGFTGVEYSFIENVSDVRILRGSKYLRADLSVEIPTIERILSEGRKVMVVCLPCQLILLKNLKRIYTKRLLVVALVCHGVIKKNIWRDYLLERGGRVISSVNWRDKVSGWRNYSVTVNGNSIKWMQDKLMLDYIGYHNTEDGCCKCLLRYKHKELGADITLGDDWVSARRGVVDDLGTSMVVAHNTEAAAMLMRKRRVGILTFYCAGNYGALLQALSLKEYYETCGNEVVFVDCKIPGTRQLPLWQLMFSRSIAGYKKKFSDYRRLKVIGAFAKGWLVGSIYDDYDEVIVGSDQVWNPRWVNSSPHWISMMFLEWVRPEVTKTAYAPSFGGEVWPDNSREVVASLLSRFTKVTCREQSGVEMLHAWGIKAELAKDPTLLNPKTIVRLANKSDSLDIKADERFEYLIPSSHPVTVLEWIARIKRAKKVVTNSYHCAIVARILGIPYETVLRDGEDARMNERWKEL